MANADCAVLVPVASHIEPETADCLSRLIERGYKVRTLRGCSAVDFARSLLATDAVRDGFAETMWVDADVVFDPADVDRLRALGVPVSAGLYPKKGKPEFACKFHPGTGGPSFGPGGGPVDVACVGFGFTHVRREVYDRIERELNLPRCLGRHDPGRDVVPYFLPLVCEKFGRMTYLSEDFSFCERARQVGYAITADTRIRLGHKGGYVYGWEDLADKPLFDSLDLQFEER